MDRPLATVARSKYLEDSDCKSSADLYSGMAGVEALQHTVPLGASQDSAHALYRLEEATSRRMVPVVAQKGTRAREAPSEIAALSQCSSK